MGKPGRGYVRLPGSEFIAVQGVTPGSETSQYRQERKIIMILLVAASERG